MVPDGPWPGVDWHEAVQAVAGDAPGVRIQVEVTPGAPRSRFPDGFDPWRGCLRARVRAAARGGAANEELVDLVARTLAVGKAGVRIGAGATGRRKSVLVPVAREAALERLAHTMPREA